MTATTAKTRAPSACVNGCKSPKSGKPVVPALSDETDTQKTYICPVCEMPHAVAVNQGRK